MVKSSAWGLGPWGSIAWVGVPGGSGGANAIVGNNGIPSRVAFGTGGTVENLHRTIAGVAGIPSRVAFGSPGAVEFPTLDIVGNNGIPSRVAFGTGGEFTVGVKGLYGIPSSVAFGKGAILGRNYITVFLDGVDISEFLLVNSVQITNALSQVTTASFALWDPTGTIVPSVGQEVLIYFGADRIFGGGVNQPFQTSFQAFPGYLYAGSGASSTGGVGSATSSTGSSSSGSGGVQCTDFSYLLARRYVGQYYDGASVPTFLSSIAQDIVNKYFAQDGITYDFTGDPGINLGPTLFNWVTGAAAMNQLGTATGWEWSVDQYKVLRFYPSDTGSGNAPFNISDTTGTLYAESLGVEYFVSQYRNRQGVVSPTLGTQLWTDIFSAANPGPLPTFPQPPDGVRQAFFELYYFTAIPTVTVNGSPQSVINLETTPIGTAGAQWYVLVGNTASGQNIGYGLFQIPWLTPLQPTDVLAITYPSQLPPIYWVQDDAQIAARAAIEGNSGVYEDVTQAPSVTDPTAIFTYAAGLLFRYGSQGIPFQVTYSTKLPGQATAPLYAGQLQHVQTTNPPLNFDGLISSVTWQDVDGQYMMLSVILMSGAYQGNFTQFFQSLITQSLLPQPSALNNYQLLIAPSYPGISNPGVTGGNYVGSAVIQNAVEILLQFNMYLPNAVTGSEMQFRLLNSSNGLTQIGIITYQPGQSGTLSFNPDPASPISLYAGDVIVILVGGSGGAIKDAVASWQTSIAVS